MTATEMEDLLKKLDLRTSRIEQILPALATKEDLKAFATKEDLRAAFEEAKRHATMLNEATRDDIRLLAEHLAEISQRLPPRR